MTLRLHHVTGSRSIRVLWLLEELGLACDLHIHAITDKALRDPMFKTLFPAGRIPALEIDGHAVWKSGAIVRYLTERDGRLAPPPGSADRAPFLSWIHLSETQANIIRTPNNQHVFLWPPSARSVPLMRLDSPRLAMTARAVDDNLAGQDMMLA